MTLVQAMLLGLVQGLTEFLPVSSSGHLVLARVLLHIGETPVFFDVLLHISTLLVIIIVFRKRIGAIFAALGRGIVKKTGEGDAEHRRLFFVIVLATAITVVVGFGISKLNMEGRPKIIALLLTVTGIILLLTRFFKGSDDYSTIGVKAGIITGLVQGIGVFPGISRSGISIAGGLASGLSREKAGEFAFLIAIPAILGAFVLELKDVPALERTVGIPALCAGMAAAFAAGLFSLLLLLRAVKKGRLYLFSIYLIPAVILYFILLTV
ncbi:MAG: undecaprenyl-diphosphate phosphatase [Spirochaetales bacterium]|nr:MAG: undecaprenyl-diphosphate phosphatase [Spirochaetales bacterium]